MTPTLGPDGSRTGSIETREAAIDWIIEHQLSRRNLNREERMYLLGKRYNREKAQGVKSPDGKTTAERAWARPKACRCARSSAPASMRKRSTRSPRTSH
jgi:hypothetical protein